jgi:hypothetical protein
MILKLHIRNAYLIYSYAARNRFKLLTFPSLTTDDKISSSLSHVPILHIVGEININASNFRS